jgi:hypothetical protein
VTIDQIPAGAVVLLEVVAVMQAHGLTHLASNDADLDRVPWLTVYDQS